LLTRDLRARLAPRVNVTCGHERVNSSSELRWSGFKGKHMTGSRLVPTQARLAFSPGDTLPSLNT